MTSPIISARDLSVSFGDTPALDGFTLDVPAGSLVALLGPSGCGKTTLLRCLSGFEDLDEGTLAIDGRPMAGVPAHRRPVNTVFQSYALFPHMTVAENMSFGLRLRRYPKAEIKTRVEEAGRILGITELLERRPKQLSGGQRQRVAIGRAIVRDARLYLFDEPLSNLDAKLRVRMRMELQDLHRRLGVTSIYVTHDQVEAMTMADKIVVLQAGVIEQVGSPLELYRRPRNLFVAGFIGSPAMNMVYGTLEGSGSDVYVKFAGQRIKLGATSLSRHPGLENRMGDQLVVGIRPGDFEATQVAGAAPEASMRVNVDVAEVLGSETFIHFEMPSPPVVTPDIEELLADTGADPSTLGDTTKFSARVSSDVPIHAPQQLDVVIDPDKFHFFDPDTGQRIGR